MAHRLVVHGADEAAAIEAGFGGVAAAAVRNAEETDGGHDEVGRALCDGLANLMELADQAAFGKDSVHLIRSILLRGGGVDGHGEQEGYG
ncbi:hypothetical protein VCH24_08840 [Variovorax boronicumulans]|nr:hypothetical protein VCH24_08840 [Variovorax boronicumulans]